MIMLDGLYDISSAKKERYFAKEISKVFGMLSILFAIFIPPTGTIMGIIGLVYEKMDAASNNEHYSYINLVLNSLGIVIGALYTLYVIMFKLRLF